MRKSAALHLAIVIISIIALLFLIGHTHHDFNELMDESHCSLCHILSAGFTIVILFALTLLAIITPFILNPHQPRTTGRRHFRFNLRAPPAFTTRIRTHS
jgi:hypothetical protein